MSTPISQTAKSPTNQSGSLFYQRPEPLLAAQHGALRLRDEPDFRFARNTNSVFVAASEFAQVMRYYPIVFNGDTPTPVAVLGLDQDNLFVAERAWQEDHYIPAYMRRYPFIFIAHPDGKQFVLGIDRACSRFVDEAADGAALFDDGKPTSLTEEALRFCGAFQRDHDSTRAFALALEERNLLVDHQFQMAPAGGRLFHLSGFKVVDRAAFANLPENILTEWHRKGWLALVYLHLVSLDRFRDLAVRLRKRAGIMKEMGPH